MLHLDAKAAHNEVFPHSDQDAVCTLLDGCEDAGLALGDVETGFSADAVPFLRDSGEQCDDARDIS